MFHFWGVQVDKTLLLCLCSRNVLFAPSKYNNYAGSSFPGVVDTLFEAEQVAGDMDALTEKLEPVKKQISIVTFCIEAAAALLNDYDKF